LTFLALASGLPVFHHYPEPIFRYENGIKIGSYNVRFHTDLAPSDMSEGALGNWLKELTGSSDLTHAWAFGGFHGFGCDLTDEQLQVLLTRPEIQYIEEDIWMHLPENWNEYVEEIRESNGTSRDLLQNTWPDWGQDRCDQRNLPLDGKFSPGYTGKNQHVWILDTGVLTTHTEFSNQAGYSTTRATADINYAGGTNSDQNGHGTHCAGSVGGRNCGIASEARIHSVRVLNAQGSGTTSGIIDGIKWVQTHQTANACDIASMSLGGSFSASLNDAVLAATKAGVIVVVAAGNSGVDCVGTSPASADGVFTVAASDQNDNPASFTNFGSCVETFAPGVSIKSSYYTSTTAYATMSGTSMATPLTAGSVALYCQHYAKYKPIEVEQAFASYATKGVIKLTTKQSQAGTPNVMVYDKWGS